MIRKLWAVVLALLILTMCLGCDQAEPQTTASAPTIPVETNPPATQLVPETTELPEANYFDLVFDTSADEGRLTARYLYLTLEDEAGEVYPGDCAVYTSPEGLVMLVDCGSKYAAEETVAQLQAMGIEKIDIVVISHPHSDHVGGFITVADHFEIGQVYTNGHDYGSATFQNAVAKICELNIPWDTLSDGDSFMFGQEVRVDIYGPTLETVENTSSLIIDANDCSISMRITYKDSSFWSSGDLYTTGEGELVDRYGDAIRSDVVKMNHHGKDTSNASKFVKAVQGKIAVAMLNNVSSKTVAMRFMANGALPLYTAADGAIKISTTGDGTYEVQTQFLREVPFLSEPPADGYYFVE